VLPVIYAITAYLQVRLSPTPIRTRAGEGDADHADRVLGHVPLLSVGPRAVLAHQQLMQIFQQWHMNRVLEREAALATPNAADCHDAAARIADDNPDSVGALAAHMTPPSTRSPRSRPRRARRRRRHRVSGPAAGAIAMAIVGRELAPRMATVATFLGAQREALTRARHLLSRPAFLHRRTGARAAWSWRARVLRLVLARCVELGARLARPANSRSAHS
jgi:hypothetical protein